MPRFWTEFDDEQLRSLRGQAIPSKEIARVMGRSVASVDARARALRLPKRRRLRDVLRRNAKEARQ